MNRAESGSNGQPLGQQRLDPLAAREALGDPAILDLAQDSRDFRSGGDAARDDLAALERKLGDLPIVERRDVRAREQQPVERLLPPKAIGEGTGVALDLYRSSYRPSPEYPEPRTFLTVNAVVAETEEEARRRALPNVQQMIALRTGAPLHPQRLVEQAEAVEMTPDQKAFGEAMARRWVVGSAEQARKEIEELATGFGVDEVMVHPVSGAVTGTDPAGSPAREETLRLLAA